MNKPLLKQKLKVICILQLSLGLAACFPPEKWEQEWEQERLQKFNQSYAPEFQIIHKELYIDWKADNRTDAQVLKLKVPMNYLQGGVLADGRVGLILDSVSGPFGYSRPKDPKEKPQLGSISFEITESGQPVIRDKDGRLSNKEDIYVFKILKYEIKGRPNVWKLTGDRGEKLENIFRVKDVNGLQNYEDLSCRDVEQLKENVRLKGMGYEASQMMLDKLANKAQDDPTPKNCVSNERLQFWISPSEVPEEESVGIYCGTTANCEIDFRYKSRYVSIITRKNRLHVLPKWQTYRQQVIKTIQQFETQ
ncbi:hypothetical protein [Acinetobacter sp. YK3]|uniref:hypothetical protein n=1 Tax=Acinetobacter sp. YK3 TaxID=1860097 RepID=UPI00084CE161|nr:hypothetical protein [Acinetobacter sp. YK3]OEC89658.1 hypothetical protein A9Z07_06280 [Acinetobacter sp. YK3]